MAHPQAPKRLDNATRILHAVFMKTKDLIKWLKQNGWHLDRIKGSHHIYDHPGAVRPVTVPVHGKEVTDRFAKIIMKQAEQALGRE